MHSQLVMLVMLTKVIAFGHLYPCAISVDYQWGDTRDCASN